MAYPPVIFLAFANGHTDSNHYLNELKTEYHLLDDILTESSLCVSKLKTEVTIPVIEKTFNKYGESIRIFHFSGHADGKGIHVQNNEGKNQPVFAKGFAKYMGRQTGVKLVFLNGCSTRQQVEAFHNTGIPAVIATDKPIQDNVAKAFAENFYRSLVHGRCIQEAFEEAENKLFASVEPKDLYRSMDWESFQESERREEGPYRLEIHPKFAEVADESLKTWYHDYNSQLSNKGGRAPVISPTSYLLCDRSNADITFSAELGSRINQKTTQPQFFIIHGPDEEEPHSLTERFFHYTIDEIMELDYGRRIRKSTFKIDFPDKKDFLHPNKEMPILQRNQHFRSHFKIRTSEIVAREVLKQISSRVDLAIIQHNLIAEEWHQNHLKFIEDYITQFWDITLEESDPNVIVIFNIIYTSSGSIARFWGRGHRPIESAVKELAKKISNCTLIEKLQPVPKGDVVKWRTKYLPEELEVMEKLYPKRKPAPMRLVHKELRLAIERHNEKVS